MSRSASIEIRVTPGEKAEIQRLAAEADVSVSDWIRVRTGLHGTPARAPSEPESREVGADSGGETSTPETRRPEAPLTTSERTKLAGPAAVGSSPADEDVDLSVLDELDSLGQFGAPAEETAEAPSWTAAQHARATDEILQNQPDLSRDEAEVQATVELNEKARLARRSQ